MTLTDGTAANTVTIDATGAVTFAPGCACTTTAAASVAGGVITWSGTIGTFTLVGVTGESKPFFASPPEIDLGISSLSAVAGGTLTASWTDTNFAGTGPTTTVPITTYFPGSTGSTNYTAYFDTTNAPFGTGSVAGSLPNAGSGAQVINGSGPSSSTKPFSMTLVEAITLGAGGIYDNDFSVQATAPQIVTPPPSPMISITKTAGAKTVSPFQKVTYTYVVKNTGTAPLTNVTVTDDNATPKYNGDDFTVCTVASLAAGASQTCTASVYPPVTEGATDSGGWGGDWGNGSGWGGWGWDSDNTHPGGTLICKSKPNGNVEFTYLVDSSIADNTFGNGSSSGWGWWGGSFSNLVNNAGAEFQILDGQGNTVLDFVADYVSANSSYPSGYGTSGVKGNGGYIYSGNSKNIVSIDTTITDNLNQKKCFNQLTKNSPTGNADWQNQCGYKVEVNCNAWGSRGFGGVGCPIVKHTSKNANCTQHQCKPVNSTATNTATVTAAYGSTVVTAKATATVTINAGQQGWSQCERD